MMLVLERKEGQVIWIGDAKVTILGIPHGTRVKVGIEAPPEVPIVREELKERTKADGRNR